MYVESLKSHAQSGSQPRNASCSLRPFPAHRIASSLKENIRRSSVQMVMRENRMTICAWAHNYVQCFFLSKGIKDVFISELFFSFIQIGFSRTKWLWSPL